MLTTLLQRIIFSSTKSKHILSKIIQRFHIHKELNGYLHRTKGKQRRIPRHLYRQIKAQKNIQ